MCVEGFLEWRPNEGERKDFDYRSNFCQNWQNECIIRDVLRLSRTVLGSLMNWLMFWSCGIINVKENGGIQG